MLYMRHFMSKISAKNVFIIIKTFSASEGSARRPPFRVLCSLTRTLALPLDPVDGGTAPRHPDYLHRLFSFLRIVGSRRSTDRAGARFFLVSKIEIFWNREQNYYELYMLSSSLTLRHLRDNIGGIQSPTPINIKPFGIGRRVREKERVEGSVDIPSPPRCTSCAF